MATTFVYARSTGNVQLPGDRVVLVSQGSMVPDTDPVVRARPDLFSTDPRYCAALFATVMPADMDDPPAEAATAAPGERRTTRR